MTSILQYEREAARDSESLTSYKCLTCGAVHSPGTKGQGDACGKEIKLLTCTANDAHNVVYLLDWKPGEPCPESWQSGCTGVLRDDSKMSTCPGRLTPYISANPSD